MGNHHKGRKREYPPPPPQGIASEGPWDVAFGAAEALRQVKTGPRRLCGSWSAAELSKQEACLCKTVPMALPGAQAPELPHAEEVCTDD